MPLSGQSIHVDRQSPMLPEAQLRNTLANATSGGSKKCYAAFIDGYSTNVKRGMTWLMEKLV
ncbi:MAG: hypothetical protein HY650_09720 [Acidobacteria bacterium]|nr:hypothetical protein [Acidobacteriota bacterium]